MICKIEKCDKKMRKSMNTVNYQDRIRNRLHCKEDHVTRQK